MLFKTIILSANCIGTLALGVLSSIVRKTVALVVDQVFLRTVAALRYLAEWWCSANVVK